MTQVSHFNRRSKYKRGARRFGNRRYGRFGNLRYVTKALFGFREGNFGLESGFLQIFLNQRNQRNPRLGDSAKRRIMGAMSENDMTAKAELRMRQASQSCVGIRARVPANPHHL